METRVDDSFYPQRNLPSAGVAERSQSGGAQAVWFGGEARPIFGWFHPAQGPARDCVVVLCNPYGYDAMVTHFSYRHLAERLAKSGIAALRFDYRGTGDSSGDDSAPDRVDDWMASIDAARDEAKRRSGASATAVFGMRVGGLLALASAQRAPVDDLVLLGPASSGRIALRELSCLRALRPPIRGATPMDGTSSGDENFGFLLTDTMRAALGRIDPLSIRVAPARRVLVIPRDDIANHETQLVDHLRACGADVTDSKTPGYSLALRGDPYTCDLPEAAWGEIVAWVAAAHPPKLAQPSGRLRRRQKPTPEVTLGRVTEEAVRFGGLFGILTKPADGAGVRARTAILLLSVGANHRIGSNRMHVRWARAWAALGFRVLRFDLSGVGDSPVLPGRPEKDVYASKGIAETRAAMNFLAERGCDRFVLGGLCSGAYFSYYTALEDRRVCGIIAMNAPTLHWKEGDNLELRTRSTFQATNVYVRRAFDARTWRRALRGHVHVRAVLGELGRRFATRARGKAAETLVRLGLLRDPDDIARGFQALCARGCEPLLVYGSEDGGIDVLEGHLGTGARKMRHAKTFRLAVVEGTDHIFTPRAAQERLTTLLTEHLVARFGG